MNTVSSSSGVKDTLRYLASHGVVVEGAADGPVGLAIAVDRLISSESRSGKHVPTEFTGAKVDGKDDPSGYAKDARTIHLRYDDLQGIAGILQEAEACQTEISYLYLPDYKSAGKVENKKVFINPTPMPQSRPLARIEKQGLEAIAKLIANGARFRITKEVTGRTISIPTDTLGKAMTLFAARFSDIPGSGTKVNLITSSGKTTYPVNLSDLIRLADNLD